MKYSRLKKYVKLAKKYGYESTSSGEYTPPELFDIQVFYSHFIQGYVIINNVFINVVEGEITEKPVIMEKVGKFKVGDIFTAKRNFPEDLAEDVKNGLASFDIMVGEKFEITEITSCGYKIFNYSLGQPAWCIVSWLELGTIIKD